MSEPIWCPSTMPEDGEVHCGKQDDNHRTCVGWSKAQSQVVSWRNPRHQPLPTTPRRQVRTVIADIAGRVAPADSVEQQMQAAARGSEQASRRWTDAERALVYAIILEIAQQKKRFTADEVWEMLGDQVPMTMGLAAMLRRAQKNGHIRPTSDHAYSRRVSRNDHDYGRHLRVWESTEMI